MDPVKQTLLALVVVSLALPGVASADKLKVAVVPGIAVNLDAARVDALSQELATALEAELDIDAIGGLEVRRQLPPDGIPPDCIATPACVADVAKRVGAPQLLFVVMVDTGTGGAIQVDTTWIEPGTGKSASRPAIDIASITDAHARFVDAAKLLLPDAPVRPKPKTGGPIGTMVPAVPRHFTTPAKITAVASAVGFGLGISMGLRARSKYNTCDDKGFMCTDSERDSIRSTSIVADAGYAIGIGCAIATTVLFVTSAKDSHLVVTPTPETGGGAVTYFGRF
jgi:hypothetical protein